MELQYENRILSVLIQMVAVKENFSEFHSMERKTLSRRPCQGPSGKFVPVFSGGFFFLHQNCGQ